MSDVVEFYEGQAKEGLSTVPFLADMQAKALRDFKTRAFPTRHDEDWKYTRMDGFLQARFTRQDTASKNLGDFSKTAPIGHEIAIRNGQVVLDEVMVKGLPAGVIIAPLMDALAQHANIIKPWLGKLLRPEHGFHALNMAALQTGVLIYLPAGVHIEEPLVLAHWQDQDAGAVHARHLIIAEEGSKACIIETFQGEASCSYLTNTVTEAYLAPRSKIIHYKIQCESKEAFHIGHIAVLQKQGSQFDSHSLSLGGKLVRSDMTFRLQEPKANCLMNGIYLPTDGQHVDHHTTVHHLVPDCNSTQDYKGILKGKSQAVFNGKIVVGVGAIHTNAQQSNKNLLLSATAEIDTKPQLEIFADDVVCSHGATVGQLDEDALFYMAARGIDRAEASRYLIQAFAEDNLRLIPHADMATWMSDLINSQLR